MSKRKMNPVKRYANGTNAKGMDPNHYIISPAEALNDYNIMLAKAEAKANSNPWLPIVAGIGKAMQTGIGIAGKAAMGKAGAGGGEGLGEINENIDVDAINKFNFSSNDASLNTGVTAAMGMNNVQQDVEVEGGEMFETPQGQVGEFKGPSHEQGGIPLEVGQDVEEGTKVYSDRLKIGKKTLAERKATRERQIANLEKIASNNLADEAVKNAAKRKMQAIQKEEAADLQFQDQVNNIQAMADTMVQTFACGTGMKGIKKYALGTNEAGIEEEVDAFGNPIKKPIIDLQSMTMTPGVMGTAKPVVKQYSTVPVKPGAPDYMKKLEVSPTSTFANNFGEKIETFTDYGAQDFLDTFDPTVIDANNKQQEAKDDAAFYTPGQVGTAKADKTKKEPSKLAKALESNMPAVGDITKLIGNYLGMTAGIKTAAEQRSTDVTHRNVFANAGEESQRLLDNAKQGIETSKAQAIVKATTVGRGGKKGARGSARGVNTMRATDWLYDTALQEQIAQISANAAQQIAGIDTQKSSVAMSADQLKGQGEYQAAMANEAAKDAYYTALGLGRKDFATGMQQTGKDLNDMKENKIIEGLMKNYGTYFVGDRSGVKAKTYEEITGGKDKKGSTASEKLEVKIDTEGNEYIIVGGKKQLIKRK